MSRLLVIRSLVAAFLTLTLGGCVVGAAVDATTTVAGAAVDVTVGVVETTVDVVTP